MEQDRIHIKLARRTPEERQADETRRLDPFMRALKAIHTAATPETMNVEDLEKQRKGQELLGRLVAPMAGMSWEPFELDGMNCAWVRPHRGHDRRRAILYCHGGGYTSGNLGYSRILASKLANVTGWQVLRLHVRGGDVPRRPRVGAGRPSSRASTCRSGRAVRPDATPCSPLRQAVRWSGR